MVIIVVTVSIAMMELLVPSIVYPLIMRILIPILIIMMASWKNVLDPITEYEPMDPLYFHLHPAQTQPPPHPHVTPTQLTTPHPLTQISLEDASSASLLVIPLAPFYALPPLASPPSTNANPNPPNLTNNNQDNANNVVGTMTNLSVLPVKYPNIKQVKIKKRRG